MSKRFAPGWIDVLADKHVAAIRNTPTDAIFDFEISRLIKELSDRSARMRLCILDSPR